MAGPERVTRLDVLERLPLDTVVTDAFGRRWVHATRQHWHAKSPFTPDCWTSAELWRLVPLRVTERPAGLF